MSHTIITVNAGSSSIKLAAFAYPGLALLKRNSVSTLEEAVAWLGTQANTQVVAFGHRVVHGGAKYSAPVVVDSEVVEDLKRLIPLAPLHEPHNIRLLELLAEYYPAALQVACFDTAFHRTLPALEKRLPLPAEYHNAGIMRYGFHGLSYEYIASELPRALGEKADGRIIVAHLGNGASMCGILGRKSRAISMGFSTLDGLMMGTRPGTLDAGVALHLIQQRKMKPEAVEALLYGNSGLKGVSGESADMRTLLASKAEQAKFAVALFCYNAAKHAGQIAVALGGVDALVFTGGIGENADAVRGVIVEQLRFLGDFGVHVIPTNEELVIARACKMILE